MCVLCIGGEIREGMFGRLLLLSMLKKNERKNENSNFLSQKVGCTVIGGGDDGDVASCVAS